jgi:polyphosphate kinase
VFGLKTHAKLASSSGARAIGKASRASSCTRIWAPETITRAPRPYTDFGLLTADLDICADVNEVFPHITSFRQGRTDEAAAARTVHDAPPRWR